MTSVESSVSGGKKLKASLDALPKKLRTKILKRAVRAGAKTMKSKMIPNAPNTTGATRKLRVRVAKRSTGQKRAGWVKDSILTPERSKLTQPLGGGGKWYSPAHVELGSKKLGRRENPWMRTALKQYGPEVNTRMRRMILRGLLTLAKAGGK